MTDSEHAELANAVWAMAFNAVSVEVEAPHRSLSVRRWTACGKLHRSGPGVGGGVHGRDIVLPTSRVRRTFGLSTSHHAASVKIRFCASR